MGNWFHAHAHSEFSCLDGMSPIAAMANKAAAFGQPALALTDHGNMSGAVQLYQACKKEGILAFPGCEIYLVMNAADNKSKRYHLGLLALDFEGYSTLVKLSSRSHTRERFYRKPRIDLADLAELAASGASRHLALTTGCYFGLLVQTLLHGGKSGFEAGCDQVRMLANWFPNIYVEIQHHNTEHVDPEHDSISDGDLVGILDLVSIETGIPPIITQDSHYLERTDKPRHDLMKKLVIHGSETDDVGFPGDSYHLASAGWVKSHYEAWGPVWEASEESCRELLNKHRLQIPGLDSYQYHVPQIAQNPSTTLATTVWERWGTKFPEHQRQKKYRERIDYELGIIDKLGFADYFLLVHEYVEWCREQKFLVNARGSCNASLVCYVLGITNLDPLFWKLDFARFLALDRTKPPDIDLDIEDGARDRVIDFIASKHEIVPIGTYSTLGEDIKTDRGSILVLFLAKKRRELTKEKFQQVYGNVSTLRDLAAIKPVTARTLKALANMGVRRQPGKHAAGYVVSAETQPVADFLPTMLIPSSNSTVTQYMMEDVESAGYIKIDLLGLRALATVHRCLDLLGVKNPLEHLSSLSLTDSRTFLFLRQGRIETGIFTFEGYTQARGCRELKVRSIRDLIVVNALYRPGPSLYRDIYLANRRQPETIRYGHDLIEKITKETFGVFVFQEQVIALLREIGMAVEELNSLLGAIKHAKQARTDSEATRMFRRHSQAVDDRLAEAGFVEKARKDVWQAIEGFSGYGFNRAHATAYSLLGYQMAWLKVNHPWEFHAALLATTAGTPKEKPYARETRRCGIRFLPPHVNHSGLQDTLGERRNTIRRGLTTVKGVGIKAAECLVENAPYLDLEDIIERCPARPVSGWNDYDGTAESLTGVLAKLRDTKALEGLL